jgi:hypothetical protein
VPIALRAKGVCSLWNGPPQPEFRLADTASAFITATIELIPVKKQSVGPTLSEEQKLPF